MLLPLTYLYKNPHSFGCVWLLILRMGFCMSGCCMVASCTLAFFWASICVAWVLQHTQVYMEVTGTCSNRKQNTRSFCGSSLGQVTFGPSLPPLSGWELLLPQRNHPTVMSSWHPNRPHHSGDSGSQLHSGLQPHFLELG